MLTHVTVLYRQ